MTLNLQNTLNVLDSRQTQVADSTFLAGLEDANSDEVCQLLRGILELLSCDACDESSLARVIRNLQSKSVPWAAPANDSPQDLLSQLYLAISEESPLRHLPLAVLHLPCRIEHTNLSRRRRWTSFASHRFHRSFERNALLSFLDQLLSGDGVAYCACQEILCGMLGQSCS